MSNGEGQFYPLLPLTIYVKEAVGLRLRPGASAVVVDLPMRDPKALATTLNLSTTHVSFNQVAGLNLQIAGFHGNAASRDHGFKAGALASIFFYKGDVIVR